MCIGVDYLFFVSLNVRLVSWEGFSASRLVVVITSSSFQSDSLDSWTPVDKFVGPSDIVDNFVGPSDRVKIEDTEPMVVDGEVGDGEPTPALQEEVVAQTSAPQEFDIGSRDEGDKTMVVEEVTQQPGSSVGLAEVPSPPLALPSGSAEAPIPPPGNNW